MLGLSPNFRMIAILACGQGLAFSLFAESFSFSGLNHLAGEFEGVDRKGHVFVVEELGMVGPIPMCASWSSDRVSSQQSPVDGWRIPLLECRFVPKDENAYELVQPDGVPRTLWRGRKDPATVANGVWKGRVKGDEATLSADLGSATENIQLNFRQGRLTRMRIAEGSFDFAYAGRTLEKVCHGGRVVLTIVRDAKDAGRRQFRFADKTVAEIAKRPSEVEILTAKGERRTYAYSGVADMQVGGRDFRWDPSTGVVTVADGWTYAVGERNPEWNDPPIRRQQADGRIESYWFDLSTGKGVRNAADGTHYEWAKFPSGDLYGLTRWSESSRDRKRILRCEYSYNSARQLVFERSVSGGEPPDCEEIWYGAGGETVRHRRNGKVVKP